MTEISDGELVAKIFDRVTDDDVVTRIFSLAAQFNDACKTARERGLRIEGVIKHVDVTGIGGSSPDLHVYRLCVRVVERAGRANGGKVSA